MPLSIQEIATLLDSAAHQAQSTEQISTKQNIALAEAYAIQQASIALRYTRGETLVGLKMGFTSKAKMEQMGVHELIWGRLTSSMHIQNGGNLNFQDFIHPRAEPEIAFKIKEDINEALTLENAADYVESIAGAIEIIDSRYQNFKFSLEDVIADNCSSAAFVVGDWHAPDTDIADLKIELSINKEVVQSGSSKAILGNPWESLVEASRLSIKYKEPIKKGMIILAGAATPAVYIKQGDAIAAKVEGLGQIKLHA